MKGFEIKMICRNCGCEIPDDSIYCLKCGYKVAEDVFEAESEASYTDEDTETENNKEIDVGSEEDFEDTDVGNNQIIEVRDAELNIIEEISYYIKKRKKIFPILTAIAVTMIAAIAITVNIIGSNNLKENIIGSWSSDSSLSMFGTNVIIDEECIRIDDLFSSFFTFGNASGVTELRYKVVSPTKIKVGVAQGRGYSQTFTVYFSNDLQKMQISPSITGSGSYDIFERNAPDLGLDGNVGSI